MVHASLDIVGRGAFRRVVSAKQTQLRGDDQLLGGVEASPCDVDFVVRLVDADSVVVVRVGVLGLIAAAPEAVDRLQATPTPGNWAPITSTMAMCPPAVVGRSPW